MQYRNKNPVAKGGEGRGGEGKGRPCDSCEARSRDRFRRIPLECFSSFCNAPDTRSHVRFDAHACTHNSRCVTSNPKQNLDRCVRVERRTRSVGRVYRFVRSLVFTLFRGRIYTYCIYVSVSISNQFLYKFEFSNEYINERGIFLKIFLAKKITRLKNCVIFLLNIRGFDLIC